MNELERVEAQALREIVILAGGRTEMVGGCLCASYGGLPIPALNWARPVGANIDVTAVLHWFDGGRHAFATRRDLDLASFGYTPGYALMKFDRDDAPAAVIETSLRIEETKDCEAFAEILAEASGFPNPPSQFVGAPGFHCFLAWDGDEPAAAAALYADGDVAWLGMAATREAVRGRGAQRALLAARIDAARHIGARALTTETGERDPGKPDQSYRNILRAGFREAYVRPSWTFG